MNTAFLDIPVSTIRAKIRKTPHHERPSGIDCQFIPITKRVGAKLFKSRSARDLAYKIQQIAHSKGEGPAVGEKFRYYLKYGLVTERLTVCHRLNDAQMMEVAKRFCTNVGIEFFDTHSRNFGYRRAEPNKIMVLDFGGYHYDSSVVRKVNKLTGRLKAST